MSSISGTHATLPFSTVVDGDTIKVFLPGQTKHESVRILALDTEESHAGGGKPVTPWGHEAKKAAKEFFDGAQEVTIEFPGNEDFDTCLARYRGNFGRLLVYVYRDGEDFQEHMIRKGFSPYFVKYGNAHFGGHHARYQAVEREAQRRHIGVWDQLTVNNGVERRNYAALGTWWALRANIINEYRARRAVDSSILNSRLDYADLHARAGNGEEVTVFTEMRSIKRVGSDHGLVSIGSVHQPFGLFIPQLDSEAAQEIVRLLETRYISSDEAHPRRSYAYVSGELKKFDGKPEIVLRSADQITDIPPSNRPETEGEVIIAALLPNPAGGDSGHETVTLRNIGSVDVDLTGWTLRDRSNNEAPLQDTIPVSQEKVVTLGAGVMPLNNSGDDVLLIDADGKIRNQVSYTVADVVSGHEIRFA
jgi:micrococcal nuclease